MVFREKKTMSKLKKALTNWRILLVIFFLVLAFATIRPNPFAEGLAIKGISSGSSAELAGMLKPESQVPMSLERLQSINNEKVNNIEQYYSLIKDFKVNDTVQLQTTKGLYRLVVKPKIEEVTLNETEQKVVSEFISVNETINGNTTEIRKEVNKTIEVPKVIQREMGAEDIGLRIDETPTSNIRKGLDLQGGSRVLLRPVDKIDRETSDYLIDNIAQRLNVYGLSDVVVSDVTAPGESERLILIEIAGVTPDVIQNLIASQGKFEAKIRNQTAFTGGEDQIKYVCRGRAQCSGIDPQRPCQKSEDGTYGCGFFFEIVLSQAAAQKQADLTSKLDSVSKNGRNYLSDKIIFYLDGKEIEALDIASSLKGRAETKIVISGSGSGTTLRGAQEETLKNLKTLQTVLQTGSLPTKLEVVKSDSVSPVLGKEFIKNALLMGLIAFIAVTILIYLFYWNIKIALALIASSLCEVFLIMGMAALTGWNLDLSAIAGIIASIGTGVDDVIIITDEVLRKEKQSYMDWKAKMKNAFFIVMAAYFTTFVAMIPLWYFGAGQLKGFAITTIAGITLGVFLTRPAYAALLKIILGEE